MITNYQDILSLLKEVETFAESEMAAYIIGGGALMKHGIKSQTKDIDLVTRSTEEFNMLTEVFYDLGFRSEMPEPSYSRLALAHILTRDDYRIDLFDRVVCRKLYLSEGMMSRSVTEPSFKKLRLCVCAPEDILIFKAVTERDGDRDDAEDIIRKHDVGWDVVVSEIKHQVSVGEDVWITWIATFFDELAERMIPIPAKYEMDRLSDEYFKRFERERPYCSKECR
ncbi:MAG: nucleotidyltransferase [Candidatus Methanoplasma sp.]|jgi:hypothetical protein|nr:nucleotidyltransferase [Candidatus Methanoplasma sp.]